jgi:hypothetical protein
MAQEGIVVFAMRGWHEGADALQLQAAVFILQTPIQCRISPHDDARRINNQAGEDIVGLGGNLLA